MPEDVSQCPLCGNDHSQFFNRCEFRSQVVINRLCWNCGLVFQSPRMTEAEAEVFYAEEYRLLYEGSIDPTASNIVAQRARAESLTSFVRPVIGKLSRHLDVGCSMGILLQRVQQEFRTQMVGIEPGEAHRLHARKEGLTVYASLVDLESHERKYFDLVSIAHVLEHLPDPVGYLVHLREKLLEPDGWLLLEVPNLYAHDSFEIAHLVSFSPHTLGQTVKKAGFEIIKVEQHGRPRSDLLPLYITLLARPGLSPVYSLRSEKGVVLKRWFGMLRRRVVEKLWPKRAWLVQG